MPLAERLRVLVVEQRWWWREGMLRVLERGEQFEPIAANGPEPARDVAERVRPAVAVVDLDDDDAEAVLLDLRDLDIPCVALSSGTTRQHVGLALRLSASYVVKSELEPERLRQLLSIAATGDALLVQAHRKVLEQLVHGDTAVKFDLTPRELDVLALIADGHTNAEIAVRLHLAPGSVKKIVSRCLARLGVRNRVEAALVARRERLVPGGSYDGAEPALVA